MRTNESNQLPLLRVLQTLSCATLSLKRRGVISQVPEFFLFVGGRGGIGGLWAVSLL